ncbi:MAG TPA: diacylglycerol kinase family protein [Hyphomicrobiaceae bacterium]|nr:diacylglycerol kinase family protein [Hyphomicrobiaceae bacterium]
MARRLFVVFNPSAGRNLRARLDAVLAAVEAAGGRFKLAETGSVADAGNAIRAAARSGEHDAIVAAGGDGTVRLAATAAINTGIAIGYIPLGTGNVLAHELRLDRSPSALAALLCHGAVSEIELAAANNAPFLLMAGMGFDGRVVAALNRTTKSYFGKAAFVLPALKAIRAPLDRLTVTVDGQRHAANWAVIANASHYGGHFVIAPDTHIATHGLCAVMISATGRMSLAGKLAQIGLGRIAMAARDPDSGIRIVPCSHAVVESLRPVPVQIDGDVAGHATRLDVKAAAARIPLITGNLRR